MSGQSSEHARLFDLGLQSSRAFVDKYSSNPITKEEAFNEIPMGLTDALRGSPSISADFVAGRLFEAARHDAFEDVVKWDQKEGLLPPAKWIIDPSRTKLIAEDKFRQKNCSLVR
ncbi:MAG TPA: hypothetical protein VFB02_08370 [Bradyrhizobium sp.]|nr:hypothetical protein [Bradyrhizobium sp.]